MKAQFSFENLLASKRLTHALLPLQRASGLGNYWEWLDAPALVNGIAIAELVCPLRYDVYVRAEFFAFYQAHRAQYQKQPAQFMRAVQASSYYVWYASSEAVRCNRHLRADRDALNAAFERRVHSAIDLYERVMAEGFSRAYPLTLKTARHLLPPTTIRNGAPTGKQVAAKFFLADGWHRLALLMQMGETVLRAELFRVKQFQKFSPFDSTSLLVRALELDAATYFRFLSTYYCAPHSFTRGDEFLAYVRAENPHRLTEVLSVLRVDGFLNTHNSADKSAVELCAAVN